MWVTRRAWRELITALMAMERTMAEVVDIIEEIRQAKTFTEGLKLQNRELRKALDDALAQNAGWEEKARQAKEMLDAIEAEDGAPLFDNTDEFPSSGH